MVPATCSSFFRRGPSLQPRDSFNGGIISTIDGRLTKIWRVRSALALRFVSSCHDLALLGERFHVIEPERWNKMFSHPVSSTAMPVSLESSARENLSQNHIMYDVSQSSRLTLVKISGDSTFGSRGCRIGCLKANRRLSARGRGMNIDARRYRASSAVFGVRREPTHYAPVLSGRRRPRLGGRLPLSIDHFFKQLVALCHSFTSFVLATRSPKIIWYGRSTLRSIFPGAAILHLIIRRWVACRSIRNQ